MQIVNLNCYYFFSSCVTLYWTFFNTWPIKTLSYSKDVHCNALRSYYIDLLKWPVKNLSCSKDVHCNALRSYHIGPPYVIRQNFKLFKRCSLQRKTLRKLDSGKLRWARHNVIPLKLFQNLSIFRNTRTATYKKYKI